MSQKEVPLCAYTRRSGVTQRAKTKVKIKAKEVTASACIQSFENLSMDLTQVWQFHKLLKGIVISVYLSNKIGVVEVPLYDPISLNVTTGWLLCEKNLSVRAR